MSKQEINVIFDPNSEAGTRFSFSPDRAVLEGATGTVDVILYTAIGSGSTAKFSQPEGIRWMTDGPLDVEQTTNSARTVVTLRGFPMDEAQEEVDYGYTVIVEYEGATFSSTAHYPTMSCVQTGGG